MSGLPLDFDGNEGAHFLCTGIRSRRKYITQNWYDTKTDGEDFCFALIGKFWLFLNYLDHRESMFTYKK